MYVIYMKTISVFLLLIENEIHNFSLNL